MPEEQALIVITCRCGQKMKAPTKAKGKVFKCVRCGELVRTNETPSISASPPPASVGAEEKGGTPPRIEDALEPIGQLMVKEQVITAAHLETSLEIQKREGGKLLEILLQSDFLSKERLHDFLSKQPGIAAIELSRLQLDRNLMEIIPRDLAVSCLVLPVDRLGKLLTVAMACPLDIATIREIERITGLRVKALLCKLDDIHTAVRRYYPPKSGGPNDMPVFELPPNMAAPVREDVAEKIGQLEVLGSGGSTLIALEELYNDAQASVEDFSEVVASDPLLAVGVLRAANSAGYGMAGQVDSLWMAVALLGKEGVFQLAAVNANGVHSEVKLEPVITRSRRCAGASAALARKCGRVNEGEAFTAGLLHQLGCLALARIAPEKYAQIDLTVPGEALYAAERQFFNLAHPEVGERLATRWHVPDVICQAIGAYLSPNKGPTSNALIDIVAVAACVSVDPEKLNSELNIPFMESLNRLGLTPQVVADTLRPVFSSI